MQSVVRNMVRVVVGSRCEEGKQYLRVVVGRI